MPFGLQKPEWTVIWSSGADYAWQGPHLCGPPLGLVGKNEHSQLRLVLYGNIGFRVR